MQKKTILAAALPHIQMEELTAVFKAAAGQCEVQ